MTQPIKVLQFSTHNENCGIAKYQEQFIAGMVGRDDFYTDYFPYSPNVTKHMAKSEFAKVLVELAEKLVGYDILHIQHELSFFKHNELSKIIDTTKQSGKKVIVSVHTAPAAQYQPAHLGGLGPRSWVHFLKQKLSGHRYLQRYVEPLKRADLIITHNQVTKQNLADHGVDAQNIQVIKIPVPKVSFELESSVVKENLNYKKGDIIFASIGFMSRMKGVSQAIKALTYLPNNYKLAVLGGVHPDGGDEGLYDELTDLIQHLGLKDRVYITGYVQDDKVLDSMVRECDICVYPYDKKYYSYVSSAAINNAIANYKAVIAYPTKTFIEINNEFPAVTFTKSSNYYELAREIRDLDVKQAEQASKKYAELFAYDTEAANFVKIYQDVAGR